MNLYTDALMKLGKLTFGANAEGRVGDFGKRDLMRKIAAGFKQIGVFVVDTSGWSGRAARRSIREIGEDLDNCLYELGATVYSAYFRGELDDPVLEAECRMLAPRSRSEWVAAMGFTPIEIEGEPASRKLETTQAA